MTSDSTTGLSSEPRLTPQQIAQSAARTVRSTEAINPLPDATEPIGGKPKKEAREPKAPKAPKAEAPAAPARNMDMEGTVNQLRPNLQDQIVRQSPQQKNDRGEFQAKQKANRMDMEAVALKSVQRHMLGKETDAKALDSVKPKSQAPAVKPDRAPKGEATTDEDAPEEPSVEATRERRKSIKLLAEAQQALILEGWKEDELLSYPDERILDLGKRAKEFQSWKGSKLRGGDKPSSDADPASHERGTTDDAEASAKSNGHAPKVPAKEIESIARKHFGEYPNGELFAKSMTAFANDLLTHHSKSVDSRVIESEQSIRAGLELERVFTKLSAADRFPQLATKEGQAQVLEYFTFLVERGHDFEEALEESSTKTFGKEIEVKKQQDADKAKTDMQTARTRGQVVTTGRAPAPKGAPSAKEIALNAVRKHMVTRRA